MRVVTCLLVFAHELAEFVKPCREWQLIGPHDIIREGMISQRDRATLRIAADEIRLASRVSAGAAL